MSHFLISGLLALAVAVTTAAGCSKPRSLDDHTPSDVSRGAFDDAPVPIELDPTDQRIIDFVAWLNRNGVTLEYNQRAVGYGEWRVAKPSNSDEYDVIVHIGSFPADTPEKKMIEAVQSINLAYMLNAPAHLAMSYPGMRGNSPHAKLPRSDDESVPKLNGMPIKQAIEQLFAKYTAG